MAKRWDLPSVVACDSGGLARSSDWDVRLVAPVPGCLTMPKFLADSYVSSRATNTEKKDREPYIDFLCGWTLQDMVWPSSTLTHRTMYDCAASTR